MVSKERI